MAKPKLLLHVCCAPCSTYVIKLLSEEYDITALFYNPNMSDADEYDKRVKELRRFVTEAEFAKNTKIVIKEYAPEVFYEMSRGLEDEPERGRRCYECYRLRMEEAASYAKENGFDIFTTTLSISPHKNAGWLNEIGNCLSQKYKIDYMYSDFKKKNGYLQSIQLSKEYNLYRQNYCGCIYSKNASLDQNKK